MRVYILGVDGYLGWPLAQHLLHHGHEVEGTDIGHRRRWVEEVGGASILPILSLDERLKAVGADIFKGDATAYKVVESVLARFEPDAVVCLAQQPSAPYSMRGIRECTETKKNNELVVLNTLWAMREVCPEAHLVQIGSMGEYGTPDVAIPEPPVTMGWLENGLMWHSWPGVHFPRQPSSFYHASKVASTHDIECACRFWGLRATDIMQGVVYGCGFEGQWDGLQGATRLDVDECFGTVLNRFCAQATIGAPLSVYGTGGQRRGFLPLRDSLQCLRLLIERPPGAGEYRVVNQFDKTYSIRELAKLVAQLTGAELSTVDNPRVELEDHYYKPRNRILKALGYEPHGNLPGEVSELLNALEPHRDRIEAILESMAPRTTWR
jgi:UDP-sulfoquinovose synthase